MLERARDEVVGLDRELAEIALLAQATRTEATRHDQKRQHAAERLAALQGRSDPDLVELRDVTNQLVTLTGRTTFMRAQVDVLEGKQKVLTRFRDRLLEVLVLLEAGLIPADDSAAGEPRVPAALARVVLAAQEDLRRDIARAMHDGPAQSLTNIVLQAQIVERLVARDPSSALPEVGHLVDMVRRTLEATKAFIFDVRPMVLDDLGLTPTLRRAARDRGQRARIPVEFDSIGAERRLSREVESALFRILDDALSGYLETQPSRLSIMLDWSEVRLRAVVQAVHSEETAVALPAAADEGTGAPGATAAPAGLGVREQGGDLPPALAAMIQERREGAEAARDAAERAVERDRALPAHTWREIMHRASTAGLDVVLSDEGQSLEVLAMLPA
jgi:two-component system, NarL family, sensor histidine kinase DegS